jgi:hypothetical protein
MIGGELVNLQVTIAQDKHANGSSLYTLTRLSVAKFVLVVSGVFCQINVKLLSVVKVQFGGIFPKPQTGPSVQFGFFPKP